LSITYGIDVKSVDDPFLSTNLEAAYVWETAMVPGKYLVDAIPIRACLCVTQMVSCEQLTNPQTVRYLPDWFPGTEFKAAAKKARDKYLIAIDGPMEYVKNAMKVSFRTSPG
jgi:hypothetical protein